MFVVVKNILFPSHCALTVIKRMNLALIWTSGWSIGGEIFIAHWKFASLLYADLAKLVNGFLISYIREFCVQNWSCIQLEPYLWLVLVKLNSFRLVGSEIYTWVQCLGKQFQSFFRKKWKLLSEKAKWTRSPLSTEKGIN